MAAISFCVCKLLVDGTNFSLSPETILRVFRADPTPIDPGVSSSSSTPTHPSEIKYSPYHLRPPAIERNWLISPPGSPPVGWEPVREEPPNPTPLAEDLIYALRRLQFSRETGDTDSPSVSVLIEPEEGPGVGVYVEDCGEDSLGDEKRYDLNVGHDEAWFYADTHTQPRMVPMPTQRPPMPTSV